MKGTIRTDDAPTAVGPNSQATTTDGLVGTAGQIPLTPDGDLFDDADIDGQTQRARENVRARLEAAETSMDDLLTVTVSLTDIETFEVMNGTYETFFDADPPARSAVAVDELPKGVDVEIEVIATT